MAQKRSIQPAEEAEIIFADPKRQRLELDGDQLCEVCQQIDFWDYFRYKKRKSHAGFTDNNCDPRGKTLGDIAHLAECHSCPFCREVNRLLDKSRCSAYLAKPKRCSKVPLDYIWRIEAGMGPEPIKIGGISVGRTCRLHVTVGTAKSQHELVVFELVGSQSVHLAHCGAPLFMDRRPLEPTVDLEMLRGWLSSTENATSDTGEVAAKPLGPLLVEGRLRMIDVNNGEIVILSRPEKFVALSYVWGKGGINTADFFIRTTEACGFGKLNLEKIPKTILDAIELVRAVGCLYLWVDCVCIDQNVHQDKESIISSMGAIYSSAFFTLIAACASNANQGLGRWRTHTPEAPISFLQNGHHISLLRLPLQDLEDHLHGSEWLSRGWTFQEHMLSEQCIIFTKQEVFLTCRRTGQERRESYAVKHTPLLHRESAQKRDTRARKRKAAKVPLHSKIGHKSLEHEEELVSAYWELVEQFTRRKLSFVGDRYDAFRGILSEMFAKRRSEKGRDATDFVGLLPGQFFYSSLLWHNMSEFRELSTRITVNARGTRALPSWSWTGWTEHLVPSTKRPLEAFPCEQIDQGNYVLRYLGDKDPAMWPYDVTPCKVNPAEYRVLHLWRKVLRCRSKREPGGSRQFLLSLQSAEDLGFIVTSLPEVLSPDAVHELVLMNGDIGTYAHMWRLMLVRRLDGTDFHERLDLGHWFVDKDTGDRVEEACPWEHITLV